MMKMSVALVFGLLVIVCLSVSTVRAEDPQAEPEAAAEPEAEPEHSHHDEDAKQAGSSVSKSGQQAAEKNPASAPWAFSVPAIITVAAVAKFIL